MSPESFWMRLPATRCVVLSMFCSSNTDYSRTNHAMYAVEVGLRVLDSKLAVRCGFSADFITESENLVVF